MGHLDSLRMAKKAVTALSDIKKCRYCQKRLDEIEACANNGHRLDYEVDALLEEPGSKKLIDDGHLPVVQP